MSVSEGKGKFTDERDLSKEPATGEEKFVGMQEISLVSGSHERRLTEQGKQMHEVEAKRHVKAFLKAYESWKQIARECKKCLKKFCSKEDLDKINQHIQSG